LNGRLPAETLSRMPAYAYILQCRDDSYYVGSTTDLGARVHQHQIGLGAAYTRHRRPVTLVWSALFETTPAAFAFEKQVQGWSRAKRQALIDGRLDHLPALAKKDFSRRTGAPPTRVVE